MSKTRQTGLLRLDPKVMQFECGRRGWDQQELARQAGLSRPTVSVAIRGGDVTARTVRRINEAFERVKPMLDGLVQRSA